MIATQTIPNEAAGSYLEQRMGKYAAYFDNYLFTIMRSSTGDKYNGGLWEVRVYPNNSFAMVLPDDSVVDLSLQNQRMVNCTMEAASIASNLLLFSVLCGIAYEADDKVGNNLFHDLYHGLKDTVSGKIEFVLDDEDCIEPTDCQRALPHPPHAEASAILAAID